jgi:hypothetical protein
MLRLGLGITYQDRVVVSDSCVDNGFKCERHSYRFGDGRGTDRKRWLSELR